VCRRTGAVDARKYLLIRSKADDRNRAQISACGVQGFQEAGPYALVGALSVGGAVGMALEPDRQQIGAQNRPAGTDRSARSRGRSAADAAHQRAYRRSLRPSSRNRHSFTVRLRMVSLLKGLGRSATAGHGGACASCPRGHAVKGRWRAGEAGHRQHVRGCLPAPSRPPTPVSSSSSGRLSWPRPSGAPTLPPIAAASWDRNRHSRTAIAWLSSGRSMRWSIRGRLRYPSNHAHTFDAGGGVMASTPDVDREVLVQLQAPVPKNCVHRMSGVHVRCHAYAVCQKFKDCRRIELGHGF
jgi:hypothetical protein